MSFINLDTKEGQAQLSAQAAGYEKITGGATRRLAEGIINSNYLPQITPSTAILDNGCGPGIVTQLLLETASARGVSPPPRIVAADFAPGMVDLVKQRKAAYGPGWSTVEEKVLDAQNLDGLKDGEFDIVIMNAAIYTLKDAAKGASEIRRVLKPDGTAVVTTWKEWGPMAVMQKAVNAIGKSQRVLPMEDAWMTKEKLFDVMVAGGFDGTKIQVHEFPVVSQNKDGDELIETLTSPFWKRIWEHWSDDEKKRWEEELRNALSDDEKRTGSVEMIAWVLVAEKS
jgi:SAM-dependent methyltransferase